MKKLRYGLVGLLGLLNLVQAHDDEVGGRKRARSPAPTAATYRSDRSEDLDPLYQGQYVIVSGDGVVHIHQRIHPNFRGPQKEGTQFFSRVSGVTYMNGKYYCQVGEPIFEHEMVFWKLKEIQESDVPFVPQPVEIRLTEDPYEIVSGS